MSITVDTIQLRFKVIPDYDSRHINELRDDLQSSQKEADAKRKQISKMSDAYARLSQTIEEATQRRDQLAAKRSRTTEEEKELASLIKKITELNAKRNESKDKLAELNNKYRDQRLAIQQTQAKLDSHVEKIGITNLTLSELTKQQREYNAILRNLKPNTEEFNKYAEKLKAVNEQIKKTKESIQGTEDALKKSSGGWSSLFKTISKGAIAVGAALAIKDRVVAWMQPFVDEARKFSDVVADVQKYTGMTANEVRRLNQDFDRMDTRTPTERLNELAGAAGRLGIEGRDNVLQFVEGANVIDTALGDDLGQGAIDQIGKLAMLFGEDKTKGLRGAMLATGSALNELGASSSANTGFITEFTSSVAGMAVQAHIAQTDIMGYASALSQAGVEGQVASGVFAQFVTKMFTEPARFARAAGLDIKAFTDLLRTDANQAILQFLDAMQRKGGFDQLAPMLKELKMQGTQAVPVLTAMAQKLGELREAQQLAAQAYEDGTSVLNEYNTVNENAEARHEKNEKAAASLRREIGERLLPVIETTDKANLLMLKGVLKMIAALSEFNDWGVLLRLTLSRLSGALRDTRDWFRRLSEESAILRGIWKGLREAFTVGLASMSVALEGFTDIVRGLGGILEGAFTLDWDKIKKGYVTQLEGLAKLTISHASQVARRIEQARKIARAEEEAREEGGSNSGQNGEKPANELPEVTVYGSHHTPTTPTNNKTTNTQAAKERREAEALLKQQLQEELNDLKEQYQQQRITEEQYHDQQYLARQDYYASLLDVQRKYGASQSELQETQNQQMDALIAHANQQRTDALAAEERQYQAEQVAAGRERLEGRLADEQEYSDRLLQLEEEHHRRRLLILREGTTEYMQEEQRLQDTLLRRMQQQNRQKGEQQKAAQEVMQRFMATPTNSIGSMQDFNEQLMQKGLISYQQYQDNKEQIAREGAERRQQIEQAAFDATQQLLSSTSSLFSALQQRETAQVDAKYKRLIAAAKKQGRDTAELEEQQEAEKMAIQKKYAQKQFRLQVLQIIAATAQAIANVWREWAANPAMAAALSAVAAAQGALQLATAKAQADQAAGLYKGGYSDEYQEGYTRKGNPREEAGVIPVHKNEFVVNHKAVGNPHLRPVLDVIDRHQKAGDVHLLNSTRMLEEAYGQGRYRGGYTAHGADTGETMETFASGGEAEELLRRIERNTAGAITLRDLRREIRHEEMLEQNAKR